MIEENDIDKLFKSGLNNPHLKFIESDWNLMEKKLHLQKKRLPVTLYWFTAITGLAAMFLVVIILLNHDKRLDLNIHKNKNVLLSKKQLTPAKDSTKYQYKTSNINSQTNNLHIKTAYKTHLMFSIINEEPILSNLNFISHYMDNIILGKVESLEVVNGIYKPITKLDNNNILIKHASSQTTDSLRDRSIYRPKLKLGFIVAPDLTNVKNFSKSSLSGAIGLEATLKLNESLSITTGMAYAKKIYESSFNLYKPNTSFTFPVQPSNIHANCDVLDIPINVNYKAWANKQNAVIVTAGLSSYIMLKEKYNYTFDSNIEPASYTIKGENKHFLGVANVAVTFNRKISNNISLGISPFAKIPLANIGYSNAKLSSTGVAFSIDIDDILKK